MTPAIQLLEKHNVVFNTLSFKHDSNCSDFASEVSIKLNLPLEQIFKTLLVELDSVLAVVIMPATNQIELKSFAKQLGAKRAKMADPKRAQTVTGYIVGGISPLGQKKRLPTFLHESAKLQQTIFISGGRRGLEIEISPLDLAQLCQAKWVK